MGLPPLIDRELRVAARKPQTYLFRFATGALNLLFGFAFVLPGAHNIALVGTNSRGVFWWLAGMMIVAGMILALFFAGDAIASERRNRTLELLRISRLGPLEILLGKLVACGIGAGQGMLAFNLTLALTLLTGGVTLSEYLRVVILGLNCFFLALTLGLAASCVCRDGRTATLLGLGLLATVAAGPLAFAKTTAHSLLVTKAPTLWELISPVMAFRLCDPLITSANPFSFWQSLIWQHVLAWSVLLAAASVLKSTWQSDKPNVRSRIRLDLSRRTVLQKTDPEFQDQLNENPIHWLLIQQYGNTQHRSMAFILLSLISGLIFRVMNRWLPTALAIFSVMLSWHIFMKLWVTWVACHLLTEMRRTGMLELTLTTPLDWHQVLEGWLLGLKRVFLAPVLGLFGLDIIIAVVAGSRMSAAFGGSSWMLWLLFTLVGLAIDLYALTWLGLLRGITASNTTRAWVGTLSVILLLPWFGVASLFALAGVGFISGVSAGIFDLTLTRFVFGLFVAIGTTAWSIDQLRSHLHENLARN